VIGVPPSLEDAVQETAAVVLPAVAVTFVGADGATKPATVTEFDCTDWGPVPTEFVAATVNVYEVPGVRLLMLALLTGGALLTIVGV